MVIKKRNNIFSSRARRQAGAGLIGSFLFLFFAAWGIMTAIKVMPIYLESYAVSGIMAHMQTDVTLRTQLLAAPNKTDAVKALFERFFQVNAIDHLTADTLTTHPVDNGFVVSFPYERRVHYLGNVDLLMSFTSEVTVHRE